MKSSNCLRFWVCAGLAVGLIAKAGNARGEEQGNEHPWNISLSAGRIDMEGDFPTKDGFISSLRVGYDASRWWTFEGGVFVAPSLKAQTIKGRQNPDGSFVYTKPLEVNAGVSETTGYGVTLDALFHFAPWKRVDPYLSLGVEGIGFTDDFNDNEHDQFDGGLRGGGGVIYNFNDEWSVRADLRGVLANISDKGTVNSTFEVGVRYVFGANVPPGSSVAGGPLHSGTDGRSTAEELKPGTNPDVPDTDHYELHIEFAEGSAELGAQYHEHLDVIGKILTDVPAATVRIEGHVDQLKDSSERQAARLTRSRAEAVLKYLAGDKWKIKPARMEAVGCGFSRPKEKPDLEHGNPANRRIEVYIHRSATAEK